jgi:FAD/FMN-containing dehydrogenase
MAIEIEDLVGLNRTPVLDMPIVDGEAMAERLLQAATTAQPLSLAGMRHSQGGHTMVDKGRMLLTATMDQAITLAGDRQSVTVEAGVTWSELHSVLAPEGLCPKVHQSSPHFTIGGSISVNCHGRDPRHGPISTTVRSMRVLCGDGRKLTASPSENPDLFRAVIGGYGSCGLILSATLDVVPNVMLEQHGTRTRLQDLAKDLCELALRQGDYRDAQLFFGWLCCVTGQRAGRAYAFYDNALAVQYLAPKTTVPPTAQLQEDAWGESEMLRAGWAAARSDVDMRVRAWQELETEFVTKLPHKPPKTKTRVNWMRASVDFSGERDGSRCDVLLEYFLPADNGPSLQERILQLGAIFRKHDANVLSTTLRLVRPDTAAPYLAYCADAPMACVAIDVEIDTAPSAGGAPGREPDAAARAWIGEATDYVLKEGGTYYLPYFGFADRPTFQKAYPRWSQQAAAILDYNRQKRIWNSFLQRYF